MIRTRDLLLYVLVLFFLLGGIAATVVRDTTPDATTQAGQVAQYLADPTEITADVVDGTIDREANLTKLRKKIAAGEGVVAAGPPVFESVDTIAEDVPEEENPDAPLPSTDRNVALCAFVDPLSEVVASWPVTGATVKLIEGARLVTIKETKQVAVGSSTVSTTTEKVVLQLPVSPQRTLASHCIDSTVIGVALDGSLIRNDETWRFRSYSHETVVGYARDGFPIYGQGIDETLLDSCGGYDNGVGYRYHIRERELFILGCFEAQPQMFVE